MNFQSFTKFALLSGGGWLLDTIILITLNRVFFVPVFYANFISSLCAASLVFIVSRKKIHEGFGDNIFGRLGIYLIYTLALISIFSSIMPILVNYFNGLNINILSGKYAVLLAKIICTPPQLIANFFMSRLISRFSTNKRAIG